MRHFSVATVLLVSLASFVACQNASSISPVAQDKMVATDGYRSVARPAATGGPTITSIDPNSGSVGSTVVINGTGFVPPLSVVFTGNASASGSFTATKITVTVPSGALTGPITVTTSQGSAESKTFTVDNSTPAPTCTPKTNQLPTICSVAPRSGQVGSTVTIDGYHLASPSVVFTRNVKATASAMERTITTSVPAGAITGAIKVTTKYGSAESGRFVVETPAPATAFTAAPR